MKCRKAIPATHSSTPKHICSAREGGRCVKFEVMGALNYWEVSITPLYPYYVFLSYNTFNNFNEIVPRT